MIERCTVPTLRNYGCDWRTWSSELTMFTSIEIKAFRGIRDLTLSDVAPVTLLTGDNGVGKTTVLEAVFALYARLNPSWVLNLQVHRGFGESTLT